MQTITVDTARLRTHCWVAGPEDSEPLLLVHGNLVTGRFFQALAERVPDRFRVVAPDLRSFGRTAVLAVDASRGLRGWSEDVRSLVEALGWADLVESTPRLVDGRRHPAAVRDAMSSDPRCCPGS